MTDKTIVLITGGNTGLGLETCKALFASSTPYHIIIGVRGSASRADEPIARLKESAPKSRSTAEGLVVDVDSDDSIQAAFEEVSQKHGHLDVLINNAGADYGARAAKGEFSIREGWNRAWNTNVAGTYVMTLTFVPLLFKSKRETPRLIFITSGQASLTDMANKEAPRYAEPEPGWPKQNMGPPFLAYRSSKVGMNMMYLDWVRVLAKDKIKVFDISPGFLATGLAGIGPDAMASIGAKDASVGGGFVASVVEGQRDKDEGKIVDGMKGSVTEHLIQPW